MDVGADRGPDGLAVAGVAPTRLPRDVREVLVAERLGTASAASALSRFAVFFVAAAASTTLALVVDRPATWILHACVGGIVLTSMIAAEHEAIHGSLFSSRWANHVAGAVCGALCLTPYSGYRTYHLRHHQHTHEAGDAEPVVVLRNRVELIGAIVVSTAGLAFEQWVRMVRSLLGGATPGEERFRRPGLDVLSGLAAVVWLALVAGAAVLVGPSSAAWLFAGPCAVFLVLATLAVLPDHYECDYGPAPAGVTSRTTRTSAVTAFVLWNASFHTAHHFVPSVPCRNLPRLHELIEDRCEVVEPSFFHYYRGLWGRLGRGELPPQPPWKERRGADGPILVGERATVDATRQRQPST